MGMLLKRHKPGYQPGPPEPEPEPERSLEDMTKAELVDLAAERGIEVVRRDGEDLPPLKADFVAALGD